MKNENKFPGCIETDERTYCTHDTCWLIWIKELKELCDEN